MTCDRNDAILNKLNTAYHKKKSVKLLGTYFIIARAAVSCHDSELCYEMELWEDMVRK